MSGRVVWLCGMPATGKTTVARVLRDALVERGVAVLWLDSDDLRAVLTPRPTYDDAERERFYGALGHLATLGADGGCTVLVSATAAKRSWRDAVRARVAHYVEVELRADLDELRRRDPKGLYARSDAGEVDRLPGVGVPFESGEPALVVDTQRTAAEAAAREILAALERP